ncbi:hypothetical protein BC938DRAFT_479815 [Jimgerdemannia flammicorona]|uniref:HhH-GPD domain-containing protein n=1 Tax=Jimgerdemannia flammicorona TaxID=994334 RepID=A0A433QK23_9FUNG|nr:hypothetical protein BC938DRAFT_479815 [Jimgerdemannia flammicorona]
MPPRPTKRPRVTTASPTADVCDPPDIEDFQAITAACVQNSHAHSPTYHRFAVAERDLIRERLLEWYDVEKREMPWRKDIESEVSHFGGRSPVARVKCLFGSVRLCASRSVSFLDVFSLVNVNAPTACLPSHVLVGLQTQVITVIDYYNRWMKAFPTIFDLAKADLEVGIYLGGTRTVADGVLTCLMCWIQTVNKLWTGLGYYSRAKRLWEGAQKVVQKFNGVLPEDAAALEKEVPGVGRCAVFWRSVDCLAEIKGMWKWGTAYCNFGGRAIDTRHYSTRYTAGAVSSIAYNQPAELVDGNVVRVLSRLRAVGGDVKASATIDLFWYAIWSWPSASSPQRGRATITRHSWNSGRRCARRRTRGAARALSESDAGRMKRFVKQVRAYAKQKKGALTGRHAKAGDAKRAGKADDMEECGICSPFIPTNDEPYAVTQYPLKMVKRPPRDEGLLAGLWEFPSVEMDLPAAVVANSKMSSRKSKKDDNDGSSDSDAEFAPSRSSTKIKKPASSKTIAASSPPSSSTYQERSRRMNAYLRDAFGVVLDETAVDAQARTVRRADLGNVVHLFSHIRKVYHVEWVLVYGWRGDDEQSSTKDTIKKLPQKKLAGTPTAIAVACSSPQWAWLTPADLATAAVPTGLKKVFKVLEKHRAKGAENRSGEGKVGPRALTGGEVLIGMGWEDSY